MRTYPRSLIFVLLSLTGVFMLAGLLANPIPVRSHDDPRRQAEAQAQATVTSTTLPQTGAFKVISNTKLDLIAGPLNHAAYLSPDGTQFAFYDGSTICFYTIEGEKGACSPDLRQKGTAPSAESIRWSPDGTKIAFADDFFLRLIDSDIWLVDVASGELMDRTPTQNRRINVIRTPVPGTGGYVVDVAPTFSADGKTIYFLRYATETSFATAKPQIFQAAVDDMSDPELVATLNATGLATTTFAISPDGKTIVYNNWGQNAEVEKGGTWIANIDGSNPRLALPKAVKQTIVPTSYAFSADGQYVLAQAIDGSYSTQAAPENSPVRIIPVAGGSAMLIDTQHYVLSAGWSPDGASILYITYPDLRKKETGGLYLATTPGQPGELLLEGRYYTPTSRQYNPIFWAPNNVFLMAMVAENRLHVVTLGSN